MKSPSDRLAQLRGRVLEAARAAGRDPEEIRILGVCKGHPAEAVRALADAGLRDFGESYLREARQRRPALEDLGLVWHFIGPLQSNKTREVARLFDWVHSLDREKIARRLSEQRPAEAGPLNVCIQVNIDREPTKSGVSPEEVEALALRVAELPGLRLRGLMAIPRPVPGEGNRDAFRRLAMTGSQLASTISGLDTLSMGMSDDLEVAIAEGATIIRPGTALFGPRPDSQ